MHKRLREACLMFAALSIAACAGARREHPIYWYDTATPAGFPETVRSVTEDRVSFEKETERRTHARLVHLRRTVCDARRIVDHTGGFASTLL
jgi:hypothetical protein